MAYDKQALRRGISTEPTTGKTLSRYFYASNDAAAAIIAAGYFNDARDKLRKGDHIDITAVKDGIPVGKSVVVTAVPLTGDVTVAAFA
jgi:hypothetical protein